MKFKKEIEADKVQLNQRQVTLALFDCIEVLMTPQKLKQLDQKTINILKRIKRIRDKRKA